jgi:hypothetical protein
MQISVQYMSVDNLWSQMPFYNKSHLISHEFDTLELLLFYIRKNE